METVQKLFLLFTLFLGAVSCAVVRTNNGLVQGTTMSTRKGVAFDAFLKIPFAEPPVPNSPLGNLRFQPPLKKSPWTGTLNATQYGPMCMQISFGGPETWPMSEDCLHLNIFTKNIGNSALKPVIFHVHGGGFEGGSSVSQGPIYLMDRDVVLVTTNYRVAAFGFLATGTKDAIGNMGLKDQVMALEWVKENIVHFGGDPNQITVSGVSAGGFSASMLVVSDMSRHLFQRAILMSGAITWMTRMNSDYLSLAQELGAAVGCTGANLVDCLKKLPAEQLTVDLRNPLLCRFPMAWLPVVEKDFGQRRFLSRNPLNILKDNPEKFKNIQIMAGITKDEFTFAAAIILSYPPLVTRLTNELDKVIYDCFYTKEVPKDLSRIRNLYLPFDNIYQRSFDGVADLMSDGFIGYGSHRFVHLLSNYSNVYYYKFIYAGQQSLFYFPRQYPYGISHSDDVQYLFNTFDYQIIPVNHQDNLLVERMTRIWEQFAKTGNPNDGNDEYLRTMVWPRHDSVNEYYLEIGTHLVEKHGLYLPRFKAWDQLNKE